VTIYGQPREPADVVDRLLWRDAQLMLTRHNMPDKRGNCSWCRQPYPCPPRQLAERARAAAYEPIDPDEPADQPVRPEQLQPAVTPRRPASAA
jgi:hypothetical protein